MSKFNPKVIVTKGIIIITAFIITISSILFYREQNLMWEGLTFRQARAYVKEKDNLRKQIKKLKRERELSELKQELEKLKQD